MRQAILNEINKICPSFHMGVLPKETVLKKPFAILRMDREGKTFSSVYKLFQIEVFASYSVPYNLDITTKKIKNALHKKVLKKVMGEGYFIVEYCSSYGDFLDNDYKTIGRLLEFKISLPI